MKGWRLGLKQEKRLWKQKWRLRCWEMAGLKRERRGYRMNRMMEKTVEKLKGFDQRLMTRPLELVLLKTKVL
jgi:hypothetical protein